MNKVMHKFMLSLVILIPFFIAALLSTNTSADDSSTVTTTITVPVACTMRGVGVDSHTATLAPNTYSGVSGSEYENGIGKTTLTAICNDDNGFSIYAIGYTGNSYDSENHTKLVGNNLGGTITTKAYASGDTTSNWSMKLTKVTDSTESYNPQNLTITNSYDSWNIIPSTYTKVAQYKANTSSSTTDTTLGVKLETTYAAFIAQNQPADTYVGQVKYTMVHPYNNTPHDGPITDCPANKICYSPNANDIEGTMGQQSIGSSATSATLLASNFSRTGYGFAGWSDRYDYSNTNGAKFYGPNEIISFEAGQYNETNGGLRLYAIWLPSAGSLQDSNKVSELCGTGQNSLTQAPIDGTANLESVSALTDQRDNETYAIAKLADGNCWMIENLRLEAEATRNETNKNLAQGYGTSTTYGNFVGLADAESDFSGSTANSLYSLDGANGTISVGTNNPSPSARIPRYNHINTTTRSANPTNNFTILYSHGNYYNWHAAIASTSFYGDGQSALTTSICPSGWQIPIGGKTTTAKSFGALSIALGGPQDGGIANSGSSPTGSEFSKTMTAFPNNYVRAGYIYSSSFAGRGAAGYYLSSKANNHWAALNLLVGIDIVEPGTKSISKSYGHSVRCLTPAAN